MWARGRQEPGAPFIKLQAVFLVCVRTVLLGPSRARRREPADCRLEGLDGTSGRGQPKPPTPPQRKEGFSGGASRVGVRINPRAVTAGQGPGGPEPCAPPRQRPLAPEHTQDPAGSDRPQPGPSPPALPPQPSRLRARSPRIRWLPHCTPPASVLRGRLGSGFDSGSGCRTAACPTLGTGRPAPPRRWTCPAPAAAAANQRAGRSRPRARPSQSSSYLRAEERPWRWAGDWSGLLKGLPPTEVGERGGCRVIWRNPGWEK